MSRELAFPKLESAMNVAITSRAGNNDGPAPLAGTGSGPRLGRCWISATLLREERALAAVGWPWHLECQDKHAKRKVAGMSVTAAQGYAENPLCSFCCFAAMKPHGGTTTLQRSFVGSP